MMTVCRVGMAAGSAVGWMGAITIGILGLLDDQQIPAMMLLLSLALFCSCSLAMRCYQRPIGDAYELGYERGRRDAIRAATKASYALDVTPIKRTRNRTPSGRERTLV